MNLIADALAAKRRERPQCRVRPNVACREDGRQRLPLVDTHLDRLALVSVEYQGRDPRLDAEG